MSDIKKYYWLKLNENFFKNKHIKKLRTIAGGDTFTIIYLKLMLVSLREGGKILHEGFEDDFASEVALEIDEDIENIKLTLNYLYKHGLIDEIKEKEYVMPEAIKSIGTESESTERVRRHRAIADSKKHNIPYIENNMNKTRYGNNYYLVMKRDKYECPFCKSKDNLCVHHISDNCKNINEIENLITVCRKCHSNLHNGNISLEDIKQKKLEIIMKNVTCNTDVTKSNTEIDKDIEIEKDIEKEIDICPEVNSELVIKLPLIKGEYYPINKTDVSEWEKIYEATNILYELNKMNQWLIGNPTKKKTKNGIRRFITNWLGRVQDKGGSAINQSSGVKSWAEKDRDEINEYKEWARKRDIKKKPIPSNIKTLVGDKSC